jgi:hypothetical protein
VHIQPSQELEIIAVPAEPSQQRVFGDQRAALAGEQIKPVIQARFAVAQPVGDHLGSPVEDGEDAAPIGWGPFLRLTVTDLHDTVTAELPGMRIAGEIHRLQMAQFVEPPYE